MATKSTEAGSQEGEIRLAAAVEKGKQLSGINKLPPADQVPIARTSHEVFKSEVPEVMGTQAVDLSQRAATIAHIRDNPELAQFVNPEALEAEAKVIDEAFSKTKTAPPVTIGMGQQAISAPASIRVAPHTLHSKNPDGSEDFFRMLIRKGKRKSIRMLSLKAGPAFDAEPFTWLSQQIFPILVTGEFEATAREGDTPFDDAAEGKQSNIYKVLCECFGVDNAFLIYQKASAAKISDKDVVDQLVDFLIKRAAKQLSDIAGQRSANRWVDEDELEEAE